MTATLMLIFLILADVSASVSELGSKVEPQNKWQEERLDYLRIALAILNQYLRLVEATDTDEYPEYLQDWGTTTIPVIISRLASCQQSEVLRDYLNQEILHYSLWTPKEVLVDVKICFLRCW
ncbi:hypothetical protein CISG_01680 [Coccidioides immitis RMSCC 3703]|uniref:Uncharacterized protein n=3 Tax=Coccidioides TaxID=5500 RepID=A0A0J8R2U6_COCIT|nr:hypothetical protein CPAG_07976 [Coccidioides posadasii RMSCC 3488]KMP08639.1 hypothetical protein CIRG_08320 [Coccidioides immitis RMSCC 2394]KMU78640.1 hypothetical protein CISG_01680 [Coccidioides immitis RMSCC 3703]